MHKVNQQQSVRLSGGSINSWTIDQQAASAVVKEVQALSNGAETKVSSQKQINLMVAQVDGQTRNGEDKQDSFCKNSQTNSTHKPQHSVNQTYGEVIYSPSNKSPQSQVSPLQVSRVNPMLTLSNNEKPTRKNSNAYQPVEEIHQLKQVTEQSLEEL